MSKTNILLLVLFVIPVVGAWVSAQQQMQPAARAGSDWFAPNGDVAVEIAGLKDTLKSGLKATRPDQIMFIDHVVAKVENKQLSLKTVYMAFRYARQERPSYPFPYFKAGLKKLTKKDNLDL